MTKRRWIKFVDKAVQRRYRWLRNVVGLDHEEAIKEVISVCDHFGLMEVRDDETGSAMGV